MGELQWCLPVHRKGAEEKRRELLSAGLLDLSLKICSNGETLLFPVCSEIEGAVKAEFEPVRQRVELPRHELVGGIAILNEDDSDGAATLLKERPSVHTALYPESAVAGIFRTKKFRVLAGLETTKTMHTEYGHKFVIDLEKAYFSARLATERQRIVTHMDEGEEVLDMFAGVGPFAIMLADKARCIWACDLNSAAVSLLLENIKLNRRKNIVPILADARTLPHLFGRRFDRVIMNLPLMADEFLPAAYDLCKPGGTIHFYSLMEDDQPDNNLLHHIQVVNIIKRFVRSYAPGRSHMVYDIKIG